MIDSCPLRPALFTPLHLEGGGRLIEAAPKRRKTTMLAIEKTSPTGLQAAQSSKRAKRPATAGPAHRPSLGRNGAGQIHAVAADSGRKQQRMRETIVKPASWRIGGVGPRSAPAVTKA